MTNDDYNYDVGPRAPTPRPADTTYPNCSVCGKPMVAGQRGTHLSCAPGYKPWTPTKPIVGLGTACIICGHEINPVFGISAHHDCQARLVRAQSPPPTRRPKKGETPSTTRRRHDRSAPRSCEQAAGNSCLGGSSSEPCGHCVNIGCSRSGAPAEA